MGAKAEELMDEVLALPEDDRREFARALLVKLAIDAEADTIFLVAVAHQQRRPGHWTGG